MILHAGPIKKNQFKVLVTTKLNKIKAIFIFAFLVLPLIVYLPYYLKAINTSHVIEEDILATVARVNASDISGTAFLVSPNLLITARHVVEGVGEGGNVILDFVKSKNKLKDIDAKVLFIPDNPDKDYAVLELLSPLNGMPFLPIGSADDAKINDKIQVVGFPGGIFSSAPGSITNDELEIAPNLLQLWAGAWPGNSGGPVILENSDEVIGILISGFEGKLKGMTYAIKIDALLNDPEFIAKGISLD